MSTFAFAHRLKNLLCVCVGKLEALQDVNIKLNLLNYFIKYTSQKVLQTNLMCRKKSALSQILHAFVKAFIWPNAGYFLIAFRTLIHI